ncbi:uncharacterized protein LOC133313359 [Gastrolobium bilobum]|uniref:uncharacterized protein LOC133313359 n=1 Tax=Gastrolobium bilobum TaxID=150636 RepID=UPI002AB1B678|nr:uncharacterized protein LOC133313359 [Gastrolobium bilobum]
MKKVMRKEVVKLPDAGIIYPISDTGWVSPVKTVPKKGGVTAVHNEKNELIPTKIITGWRTCVDHRRVHKLESLRKKLAVPKRAKTSASASFDDFQFAYAPMHPVPPVLPFVESSHAAEGDDTED